MGVRGTPEGGGVPVAVVGVGALSSLGLSAPETWNNLINGKSGLKRISFPDFPQVKTRIAGTIDGFNRRERLKGIVPRGDLAFLARPLELSLAASHEALIQSGLLVPYDKPVGDTGDTVRLWRINDELVHPDDVGVIGATGVGGSVEASVEGYKELIDGELPDPVRVFHALPGRIHGVVSQAFDIRGESFGALGECASGNVGLHLGKNMIRHGDATVVVVTGAESSMSELGIGYFEALTALSKYDDPEKGPHAFDRNNNGFGYSEAGAALVLEDLDHARARGANVLAVLTGSGLTNDAYHPSFPHPEGRGAKKALSKAIQDAGGFHRGDVVYINTHSTGTPGGGDNPSGADGIEANVVHDGMQGNEDKLAGMSGTKPSHGHGLGASGTLEAAICVYALQEGVMPPTIKSEDPIPEVEGLNLVRNEAKPAPLTMAISNNFGFEGHNCSVVFERAS